MQYDNTQTCLLDLEIDRGHFLSLERERCLPRSLERDLLNKTKTITSEIFIIKHMVLIKTVTSLPAATAAPPPSVRS